MPRFDNSLRQEQPAEKPTTKEQNMAQPKVYVTKYQPDWDFRSAADYGEVRFLTEDEMKPEPTVSRHNLQLTRDIRQELTDYVGGVDYVVMTASATNNFAVARILQTKGGLHNILRWNSRRQKYELYKI